MNFFRKYFVPIALGLVVLAFGVILIEKFFPRENAKTETFEEITIDDIDFTKQGEVSLFKGDSLVKKLDVELAKSEEERNLGLMYRKQMAEDQGMWFIFSDEAPRSFYMKNTEISLDIIYFDKDKKVVSIAKNAKPYDETSLPTIKPAMYVLEVNGGMADKWGITEGCTAKVE